MRKKEIIKLSHLAYIELKDSEIQEIPEELESILKYIQKLSDLNTEEVEPLFHFPEIKNIVREDYPKNPDGKMQKEMMKMGKDEDDCLRVESIM